MTHSSPYRPHPHLSPLTSLPSPPLQVHLDPMDHRLAPDVYVLQQPLPSCALSAQQATTLISAGGTWYALDRSIEWQANTVAAPARRCVHRVGSRAPPAGDWRAEPCESGIRAPWLLSVSLDPSRLTEVQSHLANATSHLLPSTSHLLPPTSHPPTSYRPSPACTIAARTCRRRISPTWLISMAIADPVPRRTRHF